LVQTQGSNIQHQLAWFAHAGYLAGLLAITARKQLIKIAAGGLVLTPHGLQVFQQGARFRDAQVLFEIITDVVDDFTPFRCNLQLIFGCKSIDQVRVPVMGVEQEAFLIAL
jgi:hypothetical protein